ncbi:MAG: hypothetical protein PHD05_00895 [Sphaerochaetaceae bacterium]|jgi:hypothetical protein|nr:hypothetical protein [Sphaerochaetaceae bacterium]
MNNNIRKAFSQKQHIGPKLPPIGIVQKKPYWKDPLYHFISRQHRTAQISSNVSEMTRLSELMSKMATKGLSEEQRIEIDLLRQAAEKREKMERKKTQYGPKEILLKEKAKKELTTGIDEITVDALKRRLFYVHTSPENMIKILEKLPLDERKKTAKKLTQYLRSKIIDYLTQKRL